MFGVFIIFLPLLGFFISSCFYRFFQNKNATFITTYCIFVSFICTFALFYNTVVNQYIYNYKGFYWIESGYINIQWGFLFDSLSITLLLVVTSISFFVHFYSLEYMKEDPHFIRFISYLSLFTFFMLILLTADNFVQMFLGWEGVGLCSYLLINFWFTRLQANKSAMKAMFVNRISDIFLLIGIFILTTYLKTLDYNSVFSISPILQNYECYLINFNFFILDLVCVCLFIGAMGKSAQLFLHIWLPDAMEGPTPVSALIHAATMVTAGVFLLARCSPMFEFSEFSLELITIVGSLTAFFASSVGLAQNDLKKVIAYSTCSQLGYMIFACGLSGYTFGIFHLSNHAFFKALLFLSAGSIIHAMSDEQDIRKLGGLRRILPYTYSVFLIGSLSLMGFPFLTGFYSKDAILELAYANYSLSGHFAYLLGIVSACFTSFYSVRLIYFTFLSETNGFKIIIKRVHEPSFYMTLPLGFLAFGSIFIGYLSKDMLIGLGTDFWQNSIFILPSKSVQIEMEFLPVLVKLFPLFFSFLGCLSALYLYHFQSTWFYNKFLTSSFYKIYTFLNKKWFFDKLYTEFISQNIFVLAYQKTYKFLDKGIFEYLGPSGISNLIVERSKQISKVQSSYLYHYLFCFLISLIFFLLFLQISDFFIIVLFFLLFFFE